MTTPPFVKKFDFRGEYGKDIKDEDAYYLGKALKKTIPLKKVLLGWDTRVSSKNLAFHFINALKNDGIEISYMDHCPIDYVTTSAYAFDFDLSIMFTGSHNSWEWTGLLMHTKGGDSIQGETIERIIQNYNLSLTETYKYEEINLLELENFIKEAERVYVEKLKELIPLSEIKESNIAVDIGDGSASRAITLLESILPQIKIKKINDRKHYDENSSHVADPSDVNNMRQLIEEVKNGKYDAGFAFDSDGDRVLSVDEKGQIINGSLMGAAQISVFTELGLPDKIFGYGVDCGASIKSPALIDPDKNQETIPIPIGRSIIRKMLRDGKVDFGIENVGHFYSKDFFMTDSAVFSTIAVLFWISKNGTLSSLNQKYPDGYRGQVHTKILPEDKLLSLSEDINRDLGIKEHKKIDLDGVRYEFYEDGRLVCWYAIRKSGYEPIMKCYYGAFEEEKFKYLTDKFNNIGNL